MREAGDLAGLHDGDDTFKLRLNFSRRDYNLSCILCRPIGTLMWVCHDVCFNPLQRWR